MDQGTSQRNDDEDRLSLTVYVSLFPTDGIQTRSVGHCEASKQGEFVMINHCAESGKGTPDPSGDIHTRGSVDVKRGPHLSGRRRSGLVTRQDQVGCPDPRDLVAR